MLIITGEVLGKRVCFLLNFLLASSDGGGDTSLALIWKFAEMPSLVISFTLHQILCNEHCLSNMLSVYCWKYHHLF